MVYKLLTIEVIWTTLIYMETTFNTERSIDLVFRARTPGSSTVVLWRSKLNFISKEMPYEAPSFETVCPAEVGYGQAVCIHSYSDNFFNKISEYGPKPALDSLFNSGANDSIVSKHKREASVCKFSGFLCWMVCADTFKGVDESARSVGENTPIFEIHGISSDRNSIGGFSRICGPLSAYVRL